MICSVFFFFSSRRRHTRFDCDWSSDVCSSDLSQSAEDGSANLYFYRGSDNGATTDIYFAAVTRDGETRGPAVLVSELSYPERPDGFVTVRADGKEILFNSGRPLTPGGPNAVDICGSHLRSAPDSL